MNQNPDSLENSSRRSFLKKSSLAVTLGAVAPYLSFPENELANCVPGDAQFRGNGGSNYNQLWWQS